MDFDSNPIDAPQRRRLEVVAGLLRDSSGHILIARRPLTKSNGGLWEFPGGKVEGGETHAQALSRELAEELDIEVDVGEHFLTTTHSYAHAFVTLHCYFVSLRGDKAPRAVEHMELRFAAFGDWRTLPFAAANLPIVQRLLLERNPA